MGKVYLAEHVEIGKRVALKVLHPSYSRMPDLVERFRREARAASKIGHPNIVDVTDSGTTTDGSVYFVMEYLEGIELGSVIEREGAVDVARALRIASQICRALAAAHAQGIVHRDLKPENIFLVTRDGAADVVKVLDFGIAKTTEAEAARERRLTSPGMAMGTPEYMAPEQAAGIRIDLYAVEGETRKLIKSVRANEEGRVTENLLNEADLKAGRYEIVFHVAEYYKRIGVAQTNPVFLDVVPIRGAIYAAKLRYHIPLYFSPWSYMTYRGS
jgi:hydroxyisourate hydrolase